MILMEERTTIGIIMKELQKILNGSDMIRLPIQMMLKALIH